MTTTNPDRATIFGRTADEYARWRPGYPDDAVDWLVSAGAHVVADIGAGTGKLTQSLVARGLAVHAVEPDERMLTVLCRLNPQAQLHGGCAESLPLPDASMDAVLAADAWHWFPFEQTVSEVRRVLRQGGCLGLVWNVVTPAEPWEHELARTVDPDYRPQPDRVAPSAGPFPAEETETATFPWVRQTTPDEWCAYLRTLSAFMLMGDAEQERRLGDAHAILAEVCAETGRRTAGVHYEAFCARWRPGPTG
jgi:SAM-dependent methyltransferase